MKKICSLCDREFTPKFSNQEICLHCYYELNPEKDFIRQNRERLFSIVGYPKKTTPVNWRGKYVPFEIGIHDKELLHDGNYIKKVTSLTNQAKAKVGKERAGVNDTRYVKPHSSKLEVGDSLPDGSVFIGKQPLETVKTASILIE